MKSLQLHNLVELKFCMVMFCRICYAFWANCLWPVTGDRLTKACLYGMQCIVQVEDLKFKSTLNQHNLKMVQGIVTKVSLRVSYDHSEVTRVLRQTNYVFKMAATSHQKAFNMLA